MRRQSKMLLNHHKLILLIANRTADLGKLMVIITDNFIPLKTLKYLTLKWVVI